MDQQEQIDEPRGIQKTRFDKVHLAVKLNSMHFPIEMDDVVDIAERINYKPSALASTRPQLLPTGLSLLASGKLAESEDGECDLIANPDTGIITLLGRNLDRVTRDFRAIEDAIKEELVPDWTSQVRFYELVVDGHVTVTAGRSPIEEVTRLFRDSATLSAVSEILGIHVVPFGLRLVEQGRSTGENTWFEYRIEPSVRRPNAEYFVNIVLRDDDGKNVISAAGDTWQKVLEIVRMLKEHEE